MGDDCQAEVATLTRDCTTVRRHLEELKSQTARVPHKSTKDVTGEGLRILASTNRDLDASIALEKRRRDDLQGRIDVKPGLFSCLFPNPEAPLLAPAPAPASLDLANAMA